MISSYFEVSVLAMVLYIAIIFIFLVYRNMAQKKKIASLTYISKFSENPDIDLAFRIILELAKDEVDPNELIRPITGDQENKRFAINVLLNFYEELSIAIKFGVADEQILREFFLNSFIGNFQRLKFFIETTRSHGHFEAWENYESVVQKWTIEG